MTDENAFRRARRARRVKDRRCVLGADMGGEVADDLAMALAKALGGSLSEADPSLRRMVAEFSPILTSSEPIGPNH